MIYHFWNATKIELLIYFENILMFTLIYQILQGFLASLNLAIWVAIVIPILDSHMS